MPRRTHPRIRGYDYSTAGLYLVTVCTLKRRLILGRVVGDEVDLSALGVIVRAQIERLPERLAVKIDAFVVMPNHVHAIVALDGRARQASPLRLGTVVGSVKSGSSREIGLPVWQRGYHDHVIRDECDLQRVREYIVTNPIRWAFDSENPQRIS